LHSEALHAEAKLKMNFNFNMDRIRGPDGRGQRTESRMDVICITRGKGVGEWNGVIGVIGKIFAEGSQFQ